MSSSEQLITKDLLIRIHSNMDLETFQDKLNFADKSLQWDKSQMLSDSLTGNKKEKPDDPMGGLGSVVPEAEGPTSSFQKLVEDGMANALYGFFNGKGKGKPGKGAPNWVNPKGGKGGKEGKGNGEDTKGKGTWAPRPFQGRECGVWGHSTATCPKLTGKPLHNLETGP